MRGTTLDGINVGLSEIGGLIRPKSARITSTLATVAAGCSDIAAKAVLQNESAQKMRSEMS